VNPNCFTITNLIDFDINEGKKRWGGREVGRWGGGEVGRWEGREVGGVEEKR